MTETKDKHNIDIVDAQVQANKAFELLDGTPSGEIAARVAVRNLIFAAFHLGKENSK